MPVRSGLAEFIVQVAVMIKSKRKRKSVMEPYAKRDESRVGANRPKISHLPPDADVRTRRDRQREKQAVVDERRAIKKAARQELKKQLIRDLNKTN